MFSKFTKVKNCHPDKLYEILLERHFQNMYPELKKLVLHHTMTTRDGKIEVALELRFENRIVLFNAHVFVDDKESTINIFNTDKLTEKK